MKSGKVIPFPLQRRSLPMAPRAYTFRVYLVRGPYGEELVGKQIYRTLQLSDAETLQDFHRAIHGAFEREQDRFYEFCFGEAPYDRSGIRYVCNDSQSDANDDAQQGGEEGVVRSAGGTRLGALQLVENQCFSYWFDREEEWIHLIQVLTVEPAKPTETYPLVIEQVGEAPQSFLRSGRTEARISNDTMDTEEMLESLVGDYYVRCRRKIEDEPLRPGTGLQAALKKLPAHWVEGICLHLGLGRQQTGRERIKGLTAFLTNPENLLNLWHVLPFPSREMASWILLEQDGWMPIRRLSRKYGADQDRSWWWNKDDTPETPLGLLRLSGLVFVGRMPEGGQRIRIACVPDELREALKEIATGPHAMEPCSSQAILKPCYEPVTSRCSYAGDDPFTGGCAELWKGLEFLNLRAFLSVCPLRNDTEGLYTQMLGRIRRDPDAHSRQSLRDFLDRLLEGGSAWSRLASYKVGLELFGDRFAMPACADPSRIVREWAKETVKDEQEELF